MKLFFRMVVTALLVTAITGSDVAAQTIRIGSAGLSGELLPLWIAQDRGLFKKHGLDTEVIT
ncbi:MAG: hypothetical protein ACREQ7_06820, partial [Candidatus Binatia bacterium]